MPTIKLLRDNRKKRSYNNKRRNNADAEKKRKQRQSVYQSARYRKLKSLKRVNNPTCEICQMFGIVNWGQDIHHWQTFVVEDKQLSEQRAYDYNNLAMLCRKHHELLHTGLLKGCESLIEVKDKVEQIKEYYGIDLTDVRDL